MIKRFFLLTVLISLIVSCNKDDEKSVFETSKELWKSHNIESYEINERISCFCVGVLEWDLVVRNNVKSEVFFDTTISNQTESEILENAKTIDDVFDFIESIDENNVADFIVEYDEQYGFPTYVFIDYNINVADDEIGYIYNDFKPLN